MHLSFSRGLILISLLVSSIHTSHAAPSHGIATHGDLKYPADFKHFDYVNPNAPQGGHVTLSSIGDFDSFNGFIIKGNAAPGVGLLHCTLMAQSQDEPSSLYAFAASSIDVSPARDSVTFTLNPKATFSDGTPLTADDVIYTFDILRKEGAPAFSLYYKDVVKTVKVDNLTVRFEFKDGTNRELPMILGQLPILSQKYYKTHKFDEATLKPPLGCGPYVVVDVKPGQSVTYKQTPKWWGKALPSQVGEYNFDITYKTYRDQTVWFEAFKSGDYDFRAENIAKNWANGYNIDAVKQGRIIMENAENHLPGGLQLFLFNTRKALFQDPRVRQALNEAFDYEWLNDNLFNNAYKRSSSYFTNSDLASSGAPQGDELALLKNYTDKLPPQLFTNAFENPKTDGSGQNRMQVRKALGLLKEAGWEIKNGSLIHTKSGTPFIFEFLLNDPNFERMALALQRNLKQLGIVMEIRTVAPPIYIQRVENFDFDMILHAYPESETPGNEQRYYWGSTKADVKGSMNLAGIKSPVVDDLIERIIDSQTRDELRTNTRALDRVLLWGYYGIPGWGTNISRIAYWNKFSKPAVRPKDGVGFVTWWVDADKEKSLNR